MFWTAFYLLAAYAIVGLIWRLCRAAMMRPPGRALGVVLLAVPLLPYAAVAAQTAFYGKVMRPDVRRALLDTGMSEGDIRSLRVLYVTPWKAQVYVTEPCTAWPAEAHSENGTTVSLRRAHGHWELGDYDTVWSDCGSAEGNTFPPYPEAKEF